MKWLLITTICRNPGDEFARMGVQRAIREADRSATFELLDKETEPTPWQRREFDYCVICGMPLFWDNAVSNCKEIWWWDEIFNSWPTRDPSRFLAIGVGDVFSSEPANMDRYFRAVREVIGKAAAVTTRNSLPHIPHSTSFGIRRSVCPASFVNLGLGINRPYKLCNFMPDGAHDRHFNPEEADIWKIRAPVIAKQLIEQGFLSICHTPSEVEYATELGFTEAMHFETADEYAAAYSLCDTYIGNRMHGAVIVLGGGGSALAIGYDSRMKMVAELGGTACTPSRYGPGPGPTPGSMLRIQTEYDELVQLLKRCIT